MPIQLASYGLVLLDVRRNTINVADMPAASDRGRLSWRLLQSQGFITRSARILVAEVGGIGNQTSRPRAEWFAAANVRFGSKADIGAGPRDVRFTPKSGHDGVRLAFARGRQIISSEAKVCDTSGRVLAHGVSTIMVLGEAKM
jgi:hypothetical protein